MKKQVADLVRNYLRRLDDHSFSTLYSRLRDRYSGDMGDAIQIVQQDSSMDRWLSSSQSAVDLYDMVDLISQYLDCDGVRSAKR